jgi:hypothetical protein
MRREISGTQDGGRECGTATFKTAFNSQLQGACSIN